MECGAIDKVMIYVMVLGLNSREFFQTFESLQRLNLRSNNAFYSGYIVPYQCLLNQILQLRREVPLKLELMSAYAPEPIRRVLRSYRPTTDPLLGLV